MAYNLSQEELLRRMISDPSWVMFYHREKVKRMLPTLARAYMLVSEVQKELTNQTYGVIFAEEEDPDDGK